VADIIAEQSHRVDPAAAAWVGAAGGMQRKHFETHHVARFELPANDREALAVPSMSGKSASEPSGNQRAWASRNVLGISHGPR